VTSLLHNRCETGERPASHSSGRAVYTGHSHFVLQIPSETSKICTIFWNLTPCIPMQVHRRRFGETYHLHPHGRRVSQSELSRLTAYPSTLSMEAARSCKTSAAFCRTTRRHSHRHENLHVCTSGAGLNTIQTGRLAEDQSVSWSWNKQNGLIPKITEIVMFMVRFVAVAMNCFEYDTVQSGRSGYDHDGETSLSMASTRSIFTLKMGDNRYFRNHLPD
jgi:hypothetical protein